MGYVDASRVVALLAACSPAVIGCTKTRYVYVAQDGARHESSQPRHHREIEVTNLQPDPANPSMLSGLWTGYGNWGGDDPPRHLSIKLTTTTEHGTRSISHYTNASNITWSHGHGDGRAGFAIAREPGTLAFDRADSDGPPRGAVRFTPNEAYVAAMGELFARTFSTAQVLDLAIMDLPLDYAREIHAAVDQATVEDVMALRRGGVDVDYARGLRKGGYALRAPEVLRLRRAGVDPDYCADLRKSGFMLSADEIITLRRAGIDSDFAAGVKAAGYGKEIDEIVTLRRAGIDADYLNDFKSAGYGFTSDDMIKLRRSGIDADYAGDLRKGGYDLSADEMIQLRRSGVDAEYAVALALPPKENLTVEEIIQLRRRGIDAATIRKLRR